MVDNRADAELRVDVVDRMSPALARMAAQAQAFGKSIGASGSATEKAVKGITREMGTLGRAAAPLAKSTGQVSERVRYLGEQAARQARGVQTLTSKLAAQRAELAKFEAAARGTFINPLTGAAQGRGARGQFLPASYSSVENYNRAIARAAVLERALADAQLKRVATQRALTEATWAGAASGATTHTRAPSPASVMAAQQAAWRATPVNPALTGALPQSIPMHIRAVDGLTNSYKRLSGTIRGVASGMTGFPPPAARYAMYDLSNTLLMSGGAMVALGVASVVAAAKWEQSFAQVARTSAAGEAQLGRIKQGLIDLSQEIPVAFTDLAEIASVGAQLGIAAEGLVPYTTTVAKLTATTNLSADAAGNALGRFKAFYAQADDPSLAVTEATFTNLASAILKVGVNSVATESAIVNVSTQISSMGQYAGFTADQTIGLAGALASVGVAPELSRGVITRLFNNVGEAISEGGVRLSDFARIAGTSAREFEAAWGTDRFAYIFTDFIYGLHQVQEGGGDAVQALHELGITSVRDVPVLLRLANAAGEAGIAGSLLAQTMNDSRAGWREAIELQIHYAKVTDTVAAKATLLGQSIVGLFAGVGGGTSGPLKDALDFLNDLVNGMADFSRTGFGGEVAESSVMVSVLGGALLLAAAGATRLVAGGLGAAQAIQLMGWQAGIATTILRGLNVVMAGLGVVGILGAVIGVVGGIATAAGSASVAITDTQGALNALKRDTEEGGAAYRVFATATDDTKMSLQDAATTADNFAAITKRTEDALYGASYGAQTAADRVDALKLSFGEASTAFVRSQLFQNPGFSDLLGPENQKFFDRLTGGGFNDIDELIRVVAKGGKDAGAAYFKNFTGVAAFKDYADALGSSFTPIGGIKMSADDAALAHYQGQILEFVDANIDELQKVANEAALTGEGVAKTFKNAWEIQHQGLDDFIAQNEDAINAVGEAYAKFVDSGSLINFTQTLKEAQSIEDADERASALDKWGKSWQDAYGGAAFSLSEYMNIFRAAADEQEQFYGNMTALMGRGVPDNIISDLAAMGPEAQQLVQALVSSTDSELQEYIALYQKTGFDSMVQLAAGQLAAQTIVKQAARTVGEDNAVAMLQDISAKLASGTPLVDAMRDWQLDAEGKPMTAPVKKPVVPWLSQAEKDAWAKNNVINLRIRPYLTASQVTFTPNASGGGNLGLHHKMFAEGGYTGHGGKYDVAGTVHRGEFVMDKQSTKAIGVDNLYALMRTFRGGRPAARPGGYAGGGLVGGGPGANIVELSPRDRKLLERLETRITIGDETISRANHRANARSRRGGRG